MQSPYDAAQREAVRLRMSPPNRESVAEIARDTGITAQTIYNWRSQWQKQGQLVPATNRPPEQWSAAVEGKEAERFQQIERLQMELEWLKKSQLL